ncbi:hypothetical protein [Coleofasciculus sp. F4-SAH-05]
MKGKRDVPAERLYKMGDIVGSFCDNFWEILVSILITGLAL